MNGESCPAEDQVLHLKLLRHLEVARTALAIAVAEESKRTLPAARRYFAETEGRVRDFLRSLRHSELMQRSDPARCREALAVLEARSPGAEWAMRAGSRAERLCRNLNEVLDRMRIGPSVDCRDRG